jgi:propionate CoA-transferase
VRLIRDGDSVVVEGFVGQGFAEELTLALEGRFLQTGTPSDLTLVFTGAQRNRQGRRRHRLCRERRGRALR